MNKSVKIKQAINYVKERKFLYFIVILVIIIVWSLIGINSDKASDNEHLVIWVTESYTDETEVEKLYGRLKSDYKKYGFKDVDIFVSDVRNKDDKLTFNLWSSVIDFYIVRKDMIEDYTSKYLDFETLGLTDYLGEEYINAKGYKSNDLIYGITLSEDYVFAISSSATIPQNSLNKIIDFVKDFSFE